MIIKRYTTPPHSGSENYYIQQSRSSLEVHKRGEWVKYEDVEKLLERIKVLEKGQVDV